MEVAAKDLMKSLLAKTSGRERRMKSNSPVKFWSVQ